MRRSTPRPAKGRRRLSGRAGAQLTRAIALAGLRGEISGWRSRCCPKHERGALGRGQPEQGVFSLAREPDGRRRLSTAAILTRWPAHQSTAFNAMTENLNPRRRGSYGIDAPYAAAFIAVLIVASLVLAIVSLVLAIISGEVSISGEVWTFLPVLFMLTIAASPSTPRFEASSWSGPNCSTGWDFGVTSESWTWDVAGVRCC